MKPVDLPQILKQHRDFTKIMITKITIWLLRIVKSKIQPLDIGQNSNYERIRSNKFEDFTIYKDENPQKILKNKSKDCSGFTIY